MLYQPKKFARYSLRICYSLPTRKSKSLTLEWRLCLKRVNFSKLAVG